MHYVSKSTQYAILKLLDFHSIYREVETYGPRAIDLVLSTIDLDDRDREPLTRLKAQLHEGVPILEALSDCAIFDQDIRLLLASVKLGISTSTAWQGALNHFEYLVRDNA